MTNYEKIKAIIESGHIAQVEYNDGEYLLFSSLVGNGSIRRSQFGETLKDSYDKLGQFHDGETNINQYNIKSITVYNKPLWYPKQGDLVEILPTVKDYPGWHDSGYRYSYMIGGPFEVKGNRNIQYVSNCEVWNKDKSDRDCFDYRCLAPRINEEQSETILTDEEANEMIEKLRKAGKIKQGDIVISK